MKELSVEILTPVKCILSATASHIEIPSCNGSQGIYPQHVPSLILLSAGVLHIHLLADAGKESFFMSGGIAKVMNEGTTKILVERIFPLAEWDAAKKAKAQMKLKDLIQEKSVGSIAMQEKYCKISRQRSLSNGYTAIF